MNVRELTRFARLKGLNLLGTGDFTHPKWLDELKQDLIEEGEGIYASAYDPSVKFVLTTEVCTVFESEGKTRRIHHVIMSPSFEIVEQINEALSKYGDLSADGRPVLNMRASELVELVMGISSDNEVYPAHAWTPWFGVFGSITGFDDMESCYEDQVKHIHALETGLSSDPPMNWRVSWLDRYTLLSNSDSHSPWPWRLGREANVFELDCFSYREIIDAIRKKDPRRLKYTVEVNPAYGKYHWTGHRACNFGVPPEEAKRLKGICPVCGRKMTKGVEERVEELADRPRGFRPENAIDFIHMLPLSEIIAKVRGGSLTDSANWKLYSAFVKKFGNEYKVLLEVPYEELAAVDKAVARAVLAVREGRIKIKPGYDGKYGELIIEEGEPSPKGLERFLG